MKNNILKIFLIAALVLSSFVIGTSSTRADNMIASWSSVNNDDGGTANVLTDFYITLAGCTDTSTVGMDVYVNNVDVGSVGGWAITADSTCQGNFRLFWANGGNYSNGTYNVEAIGNGYSTLPTSVTVKHHAAVSISGPGSTSWIVGGNSDISISCAGSGSGGCSTTSMTPASGSATLIVRGGTMSSTSFSLIDKFISKLINVAKADNTYSIDIDAGRTTNAVLQADPTAQCSLTFNINGNGSSSQVVSGASFHISGVGDASTTQSFSVPGNMSYTITNNSAGPYTISGVKADLDSDPSAPSVNTFTCPSAGNVSITASFNTRAKLQVQ